MSCQPGFVRVCLTASIYSITSAVALATPIDLIITSTSQTSTENTGVTGQLQITFSETAAGDFMTLVVENTSPAATGGRLTAAGLEIPSLPFAPIFAPGGQGSYLDQLDYNVSVSPGSLDAPGGYDLMFTSDNNFEGGSPQGAIGGGESETLTLFLGDTPATPASLETLFANFYANNTGLIAIARFQAIEPGGRSDKVVVPEPAALLMLLGVPLFASRRRRA
jgi:hypothetical protein